MRSCPNSMLGTWFELKRRSARTKQVTGHDTRDPNPITIFSATDPMTGRDSVNCRPPRSLKAKEQERMDDNRPIGTTTEEGSMGEGALVR